MTVVTAINYVQTTVTGVTKHEECGLSKVELHNRFADREFPNTARTFCNDYGMRRSVRLIMSLVIDAHRVIRRGNFIAVSFDTMMTFQAPLMPANTRFQAFDRSVSACIRISAFSAGFQRQAARNLDRAIGFEVRALFFEPDMSADVRADVFAQARRDFIRNVALERVACVYILTSDLDGNRLARTLPENRLLPVSATERGHRR